jgi:hypothetical protein
VVDAEGMVLWWEREAVSRKNMLRQRQSWCAHATTQANRDWLSGQPRAQARRGFTRLMSERCFDAVNKSGNSKCTNFIGSATAQTWQVIDESFVSSRLGIAIAAYLALYPAEHQMT